MYADASPEVLEPGTTSAATPNAWVCWGDSLSYHLCNTSPTNNDVYYTPDGSKSFLQGAADSWLPGTNIINRGVGSETSTEIALRQGALTAIVTVDGNTIPASGTVGVTLNAPSGDFLIFKVFGTLNGVDGVLQRHMVGPGYWTFTRSTPGNAVWVPPQTAFHIPQGDDGVRDLPALFWVGRNNPGSIDIIKRDIAAMVANRDQSQPYFVVSLTPGFEEWNHTDLGQKRGRLNQDLKALYGNHFIDLEAYLQDRALFDAGIFPSAADQTAQTYGGNPRTLWAAANDQVHYNYLGRNLIAAYLSQVMAMPYRDDLRNFDPTGDSMAQVDSSGKITTLGWTFDPSDHYRSITIDITDNGKLIKTEVPASLPSDYLFAYGVPGHHAFAAAWQATSTGQHEICVTARNISHGASRQIACRTVAVTELPPAQVDPQGDFAVQDAGNGVLRVIGWAFDHSNLYGQIPIQVTVNGKPASSPSANLPSDYLYPYGVPGQHAFFSGVWADDGKNVVCATAINTGPGSDVLLGCQEIFTYVPPQDPFGDVRFGMSSDGQILVSGWAVDLSQPVDPVTTIITMNGSVVAYGFANQPKPDLANYGIPGHHAFSATLAPNTSGQIEVCMYAANLGARGSMQQLGCSAMSTENYLPVSGVAVNQIPGGLNISGWAIDFSAPQQPVTISAYVDGRLWYAGEANRPRVELAMLYGWPGDHGFDLSIGMPSGTHQVTVIAVNIGRGSTVSIYSGSITL